MWPFKNKKILDLEAKIDELERKDLYLDQYWLGDFIVLEYKDDGMHDIKAVIKKRSYENDNNNSNVYDLQMVRYNGSWHFLETHVAVLASTADDKAGGKKRLKSMFENINSAIEMALKYGPTIRNKLDIKKLEESKNMITSWTQKSKEITIETDCRQILSPEPDEPVLEQKVFDKKDKKDDTDKLSKCIGSKVPKQSPVREKRIMVLE